MSRSDERRCCLFLGWKSSLFPKSAFLAGNTGCTRRHAALALRTHTLLSSSSSLPTYLPTYPPTHLPTYVRTYVHTYESVAAPMHTRCMWVGDLESRTMEHPFECRSEGRTTVEGRNEGRSWRKRGEEWEGRDSRRKERERDRDIDRRGTEGDEKGRLKRREGRFYGERSLTNPRKYPLVL